MGLSPACFYPLQAFRTGGAQALAQTMEHFFRSGWDPLVQGGFDGSNAHPNLAGGGLSWSGSSGSGGGGPYPPKPNPPPHLPTPWAKRLVVELADETADAFMRKKGAAGVPENRKPGLELIVDASDTTYGKVCFVAKQDKSKQIGSVILENPATVTNPKISFLANYGKMVVGTSGAFDWEIHRNGSAVVADNGTTITISRNTSMLADKKFTATGGSSYAGLNIGQLSADPSTLSSGDIWAKSGRYVPKYRMNGDTKSIPITSSGVIEGKPLAFAVGERYVSTDTNELLVGA